MVTGNETAQGAFECIVDDLAWMVHEAFQGKRSRRPQSSHREKTHDGQVDIDGYTLVNLQKAIENGPFIVDLSIKRGDFP